MLRRIVTDDETIELVLLCDPAVWAAQLRAAREFIANEAPKVRTGDLVDMFVDSIRHAVGNESELSVALSDVKTAGHALLSGFLSGEEKEKAEKRFREEMDDADVRECLAWVRAQNTAQAYRTTSDRSKLMEPDPDGATIVTIRGVKQDEQRKIERTVGARPRLGAIHYSKAADMGRQAARRGIDSGEAFAEYIQSLDNETKRAIEDFEDWQEQVDRHVASRAIVSVDGFDLSPVDGVYPILELIDQLGDQARDVVSEIALHARQVSALGKSARLPAHSQRGKREQSGDPEVPPKDGLASNASADSSPA